MAKKIKDVGRQNASKNFPCELLNCYNSAMSDLMYTMPALAGLRSFFPAVMHDSIFVVGGTVRDFLSGAAAKDIDLAAALDDDALERLGFRAVSGKSTVDIWFRHDARLGNMELVQLDNRAALACDLARRDFTINALAMDLTGKLIDPCNGADDIAARRLRPCSPTAIEIDPLRTFRAFRFSAENWVLSEDMEVLLRSRGWDRYLEQIPVERFSREMTKALGAADPAGFFLRMQQFNIGKCYLPELFRMPAIPAGPALHHPEGDLFTHSLQVLQRAARISADPLTRFCALFHDLGKLASDPALYPAHHGHDLAGYRLAPAFCKRLRLPSSYGSSLAWVSRLHTNMNRWHELRESTKLRLAGQAIKSGVTSMLVTVSTADKQTSSIPDDWEHVLKTASMTTLELGIDQTTLQNTPPHKRPEYIFQHRLQALKT